MTPTETLFEAIDAGDLAAVTAAVDADAALANARLPGEHMPDSALYRAAVAGHLDVCRFLVERGAEVYTNPYCTYPPVFEAHYKRHMHVVDYFLNEIPEKAAGTRGLGITIVLAARLGLADIVRRHIEADPHAIYQRGWPGETPLHWPAHNGYVEIAEMLLDAGAPIDAEEIGWIGGAPLQWAAEHSPNTVELLLRRGATVDSRNTKQGSDLLGMTPLIMNATQREDCAEITEMLLAAGADVNAVDAGGRSALAHAVSGGRERIAAVLRRAGAREPAG